jgi:hypothetical protein
MFKTLVSGSRWHDKWSPHIHTQGISFLMSLEQALAPHVESVI